MSSVNRPGVRVAMRHPRAARIQGWMLGETEYAPGGGVRVAWDGPEPIRYTKLPHPGVVPISRVPRDAKDTAQETLTMGMNADLYGKYNHWSHRDRSRGGKSRMSLSCTKAEVDRAYNNEILSSDEASDLDYYLDLARKGQLTVSQFKDANVLIRRMRSRSSRGTRAFTVLSKHPRSKGSLEYVVYATSESAARQQFRRRFGGPITRVTEGKPGSVYGDASRSRHRRAARKGWARKGRRR